MKAPLNWIRQYVPMDAPVDTYVERMIMTGTGVEGYDKQGEDFDNVVVGKILSVVPHENSDHLRICQVDVGEKILQIVTGAPNVAEGQYVPVAKDGAHLPGGVKIKNGKLRGVESQGMLCSGPELNIPAELYPHCGDEGIMVFAEEYPLGQDVHETVGLDDTVMDFEILANRPDCLSIWGIARETAVAMGGKMTLPEISVKSEGGNIHDYARVTVEDNKLCPRYCARVVTDIKIEPSPMWMRKALQAAGVRPINNIVDITNYIMIETGQPMHAFDFDTVRGSHIIVRRAENGETIRTLDEKDRVMTDQMLVIADEEGATGIAGVMGGEGSEIKPDTRVVLFESACFDGASVRKTSRALGMRTEASGRFEHGVNERQSLMALERACQLVQMLGAGRVVDGVIDIYPNPKPIPEIVAPIAYVHRLMGVPAPVDEMLDILHRLGFEARTDGENLICTPPTYRMDVENGADIAEEVLRVYGYDKIPSTIFAGSTRPVASTTRQDIYRHLRGRLCGLGYNEIQTFSFMSGKALDMLQLKPDDSRRQAASLINPLGEDYSYMRTTLAPAMLQTLALNINRNNPGCGLFEMGSRFLPKSLPITDMVDEHMTLCLGLYGEDADFYSIKGTIEALLASYGIENAHFARGEETFLHPGRRAVISLDGQELGYVGEVHPDVAEAYGFTQRAYIAELDLVLFLEKSSTMGAAVVPSRFPVVVRDMALVMKEEVPVGDVIETVRKAAGKLCKNVQLFDIYRGAPIVAGEKSVALSMSLQAADRTLTEQEVTAAFEAAIKAVQESFDARLR